jgi:hypothetical protein
MIKDIFKKDIDRRIEGVIKADILDDNAVFDEVDEYVVTKELNEKFDRFFDVYANTIGKPTQSIGVWISGFFGSGKSHLLKILSYILSSRSVHSDIIGELFLEKIDKSDFELVANIKKSLSIKADTLLFNIDTKADTGAGNRTQNAILQVFLKVFNEHRGYYPKQPSIANFEKNLDRKGKYQAFKDAFKEINGNSWVEERDALTFVIEDAAKAFSKVQNISYESALEQLNKLDETFTISIEDFAKEVKEYIDTKEPNYRLIFLVDEIGQFIGENTAVMLNLQSMVESLATICQGQAWVIVTSQSAIKNLISSHDGLENDFSKIMGRFDVKLDLTSQNANEVIQKRLLSKKEEFIPQLSSLYEAHKNSIKSIIHFSDRGIQYKNYSNVDEFNSTYPFVPYQLDLFQRCMIGLSNNNMFQGKHASIGERSMLNVVQKVAIDISKQEIGALASFDYFFDGISTIIRPELQTQIILAKNSLNPFEIKVLKILFLVKYVEGFSSNIENITTLLVDSLDVNIAKLSEKVRKALNTLLSQVYIQKVGDIYEFLTDAEKDIENEIKRVDISDIDTTKELADWIYDDIIKISKVRYEGNKHDYAFTRKLDSVKVKGNDEELALNIITPLNSEEYTDDKLIHKSMAEYDVIINLGQDFEFVQDLRTYIQTKKFIPLRQSGNLTDQERYILQTKGTDNQKRKKELIEKIKYKFENASIYYNGSNLPKNTTDVRKLIENAFNEVIPAIYTNINMLNTEYSEKDINITIDSANDLYGKDESVLDPATNEIYTFLKRAKASSESVTIQNLIQRYTKKPYGWYQAAIQCIIAKLFARDLITITLNGTIQDSQSLKSTLINSRNFNAIVKVATVIDEKKIKKAKDILKDLFPDTSFVNMNTTTLVENVKKLSKERIEKLENYSNFDYPFKSKLSKFFPPYEELINSNIETFFDVLDKNEDRLLDEYEDDIVKIIEFMEFGQKSIYDELKRFLQDNKANLRHFNQSKLNELQDILKDENIYKNRKLPYANTLKTQIQNEFEPLLLKAKESAIKHLEEIIITLQNDKNFEKVPEEERYKIIKPIQSIETQIKNLSIIDTINALANDDSLLTKGLEKIEELMVVEDDEEVTTTQRVLLTNIMPKGKRLNNTKDVEKYLVELRKKLIKAIEDNKEILV